MTQDASTMLYEITGVCLDQPAQAASAMLYEYTVPNTNPAKARVWDGMQWVSMPDYVWNGTSWQAVTAGADPIYIPGPQLPITRAFIADGYNGLIRELGWLLARQVGGAQAYCNPDINTNPANPTYPVGGYPVGAITVVASQVSNADAYRLAPRAFDNSSVSNTGSHGLGDTVTGSIINPWWQVDFGADRKVSLTHAGHQNRSVASQNPANYRWQGSNDGAAWTDLCALQAGSQVANAWTVVPLTDQTPYRYIRLQQTSSAANMAVGDAEFWGTLQEAA